MHHPPTPQAVQEGFYAPPPSLPWRGRSGRRPHYPIEHRHLPGESGQSRAASGPRLSGIPGSGRAWSTPTVSGVEGRGGGVWWAGRRGLERRGGKRRGVGTGRGKGWSQSRLVSGLASRWMICLKMIDRQLSTCGQPMVQVSGRGEGGAAGVRQKRHIGRLGDGAGRQSLRDVRGSQKEGTGRQQQRRRRRQQQQRRRRQREAGEAAAS